MKKTITTFASLAIGATAAAHTTTIPHAHSGFELNGLAVVTGASTLVLASLAFSALRKKASGAQ